MKFTGKALSDVRICGYLSPFHHDDQPVVVDLEGSKFVLVFSTEEKLREQMKLVVPSGDYKIADHRNTHLR